MIGDGLVRTWRQDEIANGVRHRCGSGEGVREAYKGYRGVADVLPHAHVAIQHCPTVQYDGQPGCGDTNTVSD